MVSLRPSDAGRISTSTSTAAPTEVQAHRYAPATLPNIASGTVAPGLSLLPGAQVDRHQRDPDPRADDDQHDAEVVERAARSSADRTCRAPTPCPPPSVAAAITVPATTSQKPAQAQRRPTSGRFSASSRDRVAEAHRDQRRQHVRHHRAVRGDRAVVVLGVVDPGAQRAAHVHLPFAEHDRAAGSATNATQKCARTSFLARNTAEPFPAARLGAGTRRRGSTCTRAHIASWPVPQYSWQGISCSPVFAERRREGRDEARASASCWRWSCRRRSRGSRRCWCRGT